MRVDDSEGRIAAPSRRRDRRRLVALAAALAALVAVGCGGPEYRYIANRDNGAYYRIPSAWEFENRTEEAADAATSQDISPIWQTSFSGTGITKGAQATDVVAGTAEIYALSNVAREQLSLSDARASLFGGVDPLLPPDDMKDQLAATLRPVSYSPLEVNGLSGSRAVVEVNSAPDGAEPSWSVVDVSVLLDQKSGRLYVFRVSCSTTCYEEQGDAIAAIVSSWSVRP